MIYVLTTKEHFVKTKGYSYIRVALLTPEELEELLGEGVYDVAASPEAATMIRNAFGVNIPKVFEGYPLSSRGIRLSCLALMAKQWTSPLSSEGDVGGFMPPEFPFPSSY